jgi:hypothetical protein
MIRTARRLTVAATAAVATLALGASAAQASVTLNTSTPGTGNPVTATVNVPVFSPNAATYYALAECNTTTGGPTVWATKCNGSTGRFTAPTAIPSNPFNDSIIVDRTFANVDFSGGTGTGTTVCKNYLSSTDQCSVTVSYYYLSGGAPQFLGADKADITF